MSQKLNIPAYFVRSTDLTKFIVKDILNNTIVIMTESEYRNFIELL